MYCIYMERERETERKNGLFNYVTILYGIADTDKILIFYLVLFIGLP